MAVQEWGSSKPKLEKAVAAGKMEDFLNGAHFPSKDQASFERSGRVAEMKPSLSPEHAKAANLVALLARSGQEGGGRE